MTDSLMGIEWAEESLICKARLYSEQMESHTREDWRFAFWSALILEFVGRAALAHISPVLIAESRNWQNLIHALGMESTDGRVRKSIATEEVFKRLRDLLPCFSDEMCNFCIFHLQQRNEELHTGAVVFDRLTASVWLPKFYWVCETMLKSMDRNLVDLMNDPHASELISSLGDKARKSTNESIKIHAGVWNEKSEKERKTAEMQADVWSSRRFGHRVECPSCKCTAIVMGTPHGQVITEARDDEIVQRQTYLPSNFECIACRLKIAGQSKLLTCGLSDSFTITTVCSPEEFYGLFNEYDLEEAREEAVRSAAEIYEPDFND